MNGVRDITSGQTLCMTRRTLLQGAGSAAILSFMGAGDQRKDVTRKKPARLKPGDTVGLVNPAGATFVRSDIDVVEESLAALGLKTVRAAHLLDRYGYLAGPDAARADDITTMFRDDGVDGIVAVRGGWGCNRILPLLDYDLIAGHPKVLMGYSDITSLLVALYARAGLVTFHGPVGTSTWNSFSVNHVKALLFDGVAETLCNPTDKGDNLAPTRDRVVTIHGGKARGRLVGGNLSVLSSMIGSSFLPPWEETILFLEETDEPVYRIDRMLTQLNLAGVLSAIKGFVFGKCTNCTPGEGYGSLTFEDVLADHIAPLGIPAWYGAMIGHIEDKFTIPVGVTAEIDADAGCIHLLEPAVA